MRVLVSAYACEPAIGSEPAVGWNWIQEIARQHQVWAITRRTNRAAIQRLDRQQVAPVHWVFVDLPDRARFWKKGRRGLYVYYYLWQIRAYQVAREMHPHIDFERVHHVTFVTYWLPSLTCLLPVPFIWGPVGGGETAPAAFFRSFGWQGQLHETLRGAAQASAAWNPAVRLTARRARVALATTYESAARMRALGASQVDVRPAIGLNDDEIDRLAQVPTRHSPACRFLSAGRLVHWKGFHLGMAAFARAQRALPGSEYWLVGGGPELKRLKAMAAGFGVEDRVRFLGTVPRQAVFENILPQCDVLVHPSLHDSGGMVSLEAMAAGRPVICLDLGGLALQVTGATGEKIPAHAPQQVIADLAQAMIDLADDPAARSRKAQAARTRVREHFSASARRACIAEIYDL